MCRCGTVWPAAGPSLMPMFQPCGLVAARQAGAGFVQQGQQAGALVGRELEERCPHVPARDDERVAGRHRVRVAHDQARGVAAGDALGAQVAEGAGLGWHGMSLNNVDRARRGLCGACQVEKNEPKPPHPSVQWS
jgi:hypothetical protein